MNLGTRRGATRRDPYRSGVGSGKGVGRRVCNNLFSLGLLSGLRVRLCIRVPGPAVTRQGYEL